jgi:predicted DNA binding CopG/RHH family protein
MDLPHQPPTTQDRRREARVQIALSSGEVERLKAASQASGLPVAQILRHGGLQLADGLTRLSGS